MAYVADLHIHSRFSRACSPQLSIPNLAEWAKLKGINLLGTGDFLHPLWLSELKSQLKEDGSGFMVHGSSEVKFVLTVEIASIYTHKGKGRRIHSLVFMPSFEAADKFQKALLSKRATLASDGRPIVGIRTKDLLYMALETSDKAIFIPAHVWTPWFGIFGSESGYDSLKDCFEDLTDKVYGIETGLSSDPAMNWRIAELDNRSIISCSDANSLPNLGREATVFGGELTYDGLWNAIAYPMRHAELVSASQQKEILNQVPPDLIGVQDDKVVGTIEFYPEEGKYHYTGHRNCEVKLNSEEERAKGTTCPVCGKGLTVGVMSRVGEIANRTEEELGIIKQDLLIKSQKFVRPPYKMLVPLLQIIAEVFSSTPTSQKVLNEYKKLASNLGGEIKVLTKVDLVEIEKLSDKKIAEGIGKVRRGELRIDPGYDGVYGVVKIWNDVKSLEEKKEQTPQLGLFD